MFPGTPIYCEKTMTTRNDERLKFKARLLQQAELYEQHAKKYKTDHLCLKRGLHLMFSDAAVSAHNRADHVMQYGCAAAQVAETPQRCEYDACAMIKSFAKFAEDRSSRKELRRDIQIYGGRALKAERHRVTLSECEYRKLMAMRG